MVRGRSVDWNNLVISKAHNFHRKSPASAQTPATDSLAALARRPLSFAIVTKRNPEQIIRAA
jgi:hypothetical protein